MLYTREVERFAADNGLSLMLEGGRMFVFTPAGSWCIEEGDGLRLMHKKERGDRSSYRDQNINCSDITEILAYIAGRREKGTHESFQMIDALAVSGV